MSSSWPATGGTASIRIVVHEGSPTMPRGTIKAVAIVHNETSTGVTTRMADVRQEMDAANHPALLLVDTISSLGSIDYRHDEWGVDVTVAGSQKGLMLPPGLGFNADQREGACRCQVGAAAQGRTGTGSR